MSQPTWSRASGVWLFALFTGTAVHAAPFDERLAAPKVSAVELREKLQQRFKAADAASAGGVEAQMRNAAAHQDWVDLEFALRRRLEEGQSLGDDAELSQYGLEKKPDGSYHVHTKRFPQWRSLDRQLLWFADAQALEGFLPALQARGFLPEDIDVLREYVRAHDVASAMFPEQKELVQTFARRAATAGKEDVLAYVHQGNRLRREYERRWAVGLLDALSAQSRRVLVAHLVEEWPEERVLGAPEPTIDARIAETLTLFRSGEYQRRLDAQEAELSRRNQQ